MLQGAIGFPSPTLDEELYSLFDVINFCFYFCKKFVLVLYHLAVV